MDDGSFERWSERLTEIRKNRQHTFDQKIQDKADSFGPEEFFEVAKNNLEDVMEACFGFEQKSLDENPLADVAQEQETIRAEMESILDFEIEALDRDKAAILSRITWDMEQLQKVEPSYQKFTDELRNKYAIKVKGLIAPGKQRVQETVAPAMNVRYSGNSGGSGVGLIVMFVIGLLLGGAPSIYFMDVAKKTERSTQEERSKVLTEQRMLSENMAVLQDSFEQLAMGKSKNIPDYDREINKAKATFADARHNVEKNYLKDRERYLKKIPAGDRQDSVLDELNRNKETELEKIRKKESSIIDPLIKQRDVLKELLTN